MDLSEERLKRFSDVFPCLGTDFIKMSDIMVVSKLREGERERGDVKLGRSKLHCVKNWRSQHTRSIPPTYMKAMLHVCIQECNV